MKSEFSFQVQYPLTQTPQLADEPLVENLFEDYSAELEFYDAILSTLSFFRYDLTDEQFTLAERVVSQWREIHQNGNLHPFFFVLVQEAWQIAMDHSEQRVMISFLRDVLGSYYSLESISSFIHEWIFANLTK